MAQQYFYTSSAVQTTLAASLGAVSAGSTGQTVQVASIAGWPTQFPAPMLLEWGTVNQERVTLTQAATGGGPFTFANCIRGDDGTAAPAHGSGAAVYHGVTAVDFFQAAPVFNACAYGADPTGVSTTSDVGIQAALNACSAAGGGTVFLPPGVYQCSQTPQIHSNTTLQGAGMQVTTIRAKANFQPTRVGLNTGAPLTASYGNGGQGSSIQSNIRVTGITFDGNQANNTLSGTGIPGYADSQECSAFSLWYSDNVTIDNIEVINSIGYSLYLQSVTNFTVLNCRVISGTTTTPGWTQQDGIHMTDCQYGRVIGNDVDTGTLPAAGDDAIAIQAFSTSNNDITIKGNVIRAAAAGVDLAIQGGTITDVTITGNDIWQTAGAGVSFAVFTWATGSLISNVTISGNVFSAIGTGAVGGTGGIAMANNATTNLFWKNVTITGNIFGTFGTPASDIFGIYATLGTGLTVSSNTLSMYSGTNACIQIGDSGRGVTDFTVSGNQVICTASTTTGMLIEDSTLGSVTGNMLYGALGAGSTGISLLGSTTAPIGMAVTGNRISNYATGIAESPTSGADQPSYNLYVGNNLHGCTAFISSPLGTGDVSANNIVT